MKKRYLLLTALCLPLLLTACDGTTEEGGDDDPVTTYEVPDAHEEVDFDYTNTETLEEPNYDNQLEGAYTDFEAQKAELHVNKVDELEDRDDFAFGIDASMIYAIEQAGGVYYNEDGYEQDIFTLLKKGGANYFRVRLWNDPTYAGISYGGGGNSLEVDIELAKRAQAVGMNILIDFHYSDFWADPDYQVTPKDWTGLTLDELLEEVYSFSYECIEAFKDAGVTVNAVQIGNEINNGILEGYGDIDWSDTDASFKTVSEILKAGIAGVRASDDDIYTIIHLANGGSWDEFEAYFTYLEENNVPYDIIGASYYPYYHGSIDLLAENLNNCAEKFGKPVMVMETSYGYTDDSSNEWVGNTYNSTYEDDGGYITSMQGQLTSLRDVVETVASVPNNMGLGVFYWEPCWLPVEPTFDSYDIPLTEAGWATEYGICYKDYNNNLNYLDNIKENEDNNLYKSTWANQGWFTYDGQALPTLYAYQYIKEGLNEIDEIALKYRNLSVSYTYNRADEEDELPSTVDVVTNLDAIRDYDVTWDLSGVDLTTDGTYTCYGIINWTQEPTDNNWYCYLTVEVIQNYIVDGGFEKQSETSTSDNLGGDWTIYSTSPSGEKVVKLNRKPVDVRTGTTDVNFYYTQEFGFDFGQEISLTEAGTYSLTSYIMGINMASYSGTVEMYVLIDGTYQTVDATSKMIGWSSGYQEVNLEFTITEAKDIIVGYQASGLSALVWGHIDDFELVKLAD